MTQDELNAALAASPSPDRITPDYMRSRIASRTFFRATGTLTICVLTLDNGFTVTGESACAAPENYRQDIGEHYAEERAFEKLWPLFGFALKEAMAARDATKPQAVAPEVGWAPFTSAKVVDCAVIRAAEFQEDGSGKVAVRNENGGTHIVNVPAGFRRKPGDVAEGDILIRYADGYLSHIPRAKFEEPGAYTPRNPTPTDYRDRVRAERAELADRLSKLRGFIKVDSRADDLHRLQAAAMGKYLEILDARIAVLPA